MAARASVREWVAAGVGLAVLVTYWGVVVPSLPRPAFGDADLAVYAKTVEYMRGGEPYYDAMADGLANVVQPGGEAFRGSTIRSFRLPTMFWLWQVPGLFSWAATLSVVVLTACLIGFAWRPFAGLAIAAWMLLVLWPTETFHLPGMGYPWPRWGYVETWVVPLLVGAVLALRWDRWLLALGLVFGAALIRETAAPVLLAGAVAAYLYRRPVLPWLVAAIAWSAFFAWHVSQVIPRLVPHGEEPPLIGTGSFEGLLQNTAAGLSVLGLAVVVYVVWTRRGAAAWWLMLPLLLGIPLFGFLAERAYWSFLVLPVAVAILGEGRRRSLTPAGAEGLADAISP